MTIGVKIIIYVNPRTANGSPMAPTVKNPNSTEGPASPVTVAMVVRVKMKELKKLLTRNDQGC